MALVVGCHPRNRAKHSLPLPAALGSFRSLKIDITVASGQKGLEGTCWPQRAGWGWQGAESGERGRPWGWARADRAEVTHGDGCVCVCEPVGVYTHVCPQVWTPVYSEERLGVWQE